MNVGISASSHGKILLLAVSLNTSAAASTAAGKEKEQRHTEDKDESYTATEPSVLTGSLSQESCHYITLNEWQCNLI